MQAVILGIVQGLAEFLPISSSGHLILTSWVFAWEDQGLAFDVALHLGTLLAVIFYFRKDIHSLVNNFFKLLRKDSRDLSAESKQWLVIYLAIATIPAVIAGLFLEDIASTVFRNPVLVVVTLIAGGLMLWLADVLGRKQLSMRSLTPGKALLIGCFQALAIIPGMSRSGSTITAGLIGGLNRANAAKFGFLLSVPVIFGAGMLKLPEIFSTSDVGMLLVGFITSFLAGLGAIYFLMGYVQKRSYAVFALYRFALAAIIIIIYFSR